MIRIRILPDKSAATDLRKKLEAQLFKPEGILIKEPMHTLIYKMYWCNSLKFSLIFFHLVDIQIALKTQMNEVCANDSKNSQEQA